MASFSSPTTIYNSNMHPVLVETLLELSGHRNLYIIKDITDVRWDLITQVSVKAQMDILLDSFWTNGYFHARKKSKTYKFVGVIAVRNELNKKFHIRM